MSKILVIDDENRIIEISKDASEGEIIDASGKIVCPRFINAHTHIGDSIIKDEGDGLSLDEMVKPPHGIKHVALEIIVKVALKVSSLSRRHQRTFR